MRSKIEANEYKDYILGFIFYKFLSDKQEKYLKGDDDTDEYLHYLAEGDDETIEHVRRNLGYFIACGNLFSTWIKKGNDFTVSDVTAALSSFARNINPSYRKVFGGIFDTLEKGLSKFGETDSARTKAIRDLVYLINDIPMNAQHDYDVLGFIYEYLLSNFAANAGKAGEFYTPHEASFLMSEIVAHHLQDRKEIKIYDPTSGSGSLLINIGKSASRFMRNGDNIKYYAQELKTNAYNLTRMNLVMRNVLPDNIVTRNADTLENDWPFFEDNDPAGTYDPLRVDAVVSNPPYSQSWDSSNRENDSRYNRYGLAPKGKADYAFLLHALFHLKPDGIMTIVLPHGVLFRGGAEGEIRKNLIENDKISTIIGLPANAFFGTSIPVLIMVLRQKRANTDVLIVDASKGFEKVGNKNVLRARDVKKILDAVFSRSNIDKFARVISKDEIRANDYNLNIPRYVDASDKVESWDIYASMFGGIPEAELAELQEYWNAFPNIKDALFLSTNDAYCNVKVPDIKAVLEAHPDVGKFAKQFGKAFEGFDSYLATELIDGRLTLNIQQEEARLGSQIFERLSGIPLVDKYAAYQLLDNEWKKIAVDLEIIQTEGEKAIRQVDPNMVIKKKNGKKQEVQEGWVGHIMPFELVQETLLTKEWCVLQEQQARLEEFASEYDSLLDELSEDDKEKDFISEDKDAFVAKAVKAAVKAKMEEPAVLDVLQKVVKTMKEEAALKKAVKEGKEALHAQTKLYIAGLRDDEITLLLRRKWVEPLVNQLEALPAASVNALAAKLAALCKKYDTTLTEIDSQIKETETSLASMLDELTGNEFDMQGINELKKMLKGDI